MTDQPAIRATKSDEDQAREIALMFWDSVSFLESERAIVAAVVAARQEAYAKCEAIAREYGSRHDYNVTRESSADEIADAIAALRDAKTGG